MQTAAGLAAEVALQEKNRRLFWDLFIAFEIY